MLGALKLVKLVNLFLSIYLKPNNTFANLEAWGKNSLERHLKIFSNAHVSLSVPQLPMQFTMITVCTSTG